MGIALGLGAALSWGLADYFAATASRAVGALRVVLGFHVVALVPLAALVVATGALAQLKPSQLPVFVLVGGIGWLSYLCFYGALAIGPISVLSPIVSGYAAVTVLLAVLISGERLTAGQTVAVVVTILGAGIASADLRAIAGTRLMRRSALGFLLALGAMALLGGFVFGVSYYHRRIGWLGPIFLGRGFSALFLLAQSVLAGGVRRPMPRAVRLVIVGLALVDTAGYVCFNIGARHAATAVVATASAPYAVVPILMGTLLLRERPSPSQWFGVAVVLAGLVTLGVTS